MKKLDTPNLTMRKFKENDDDDLLEIVSSKHVAKYSNFKPYESKKDIIKLIESNIQDYSTYEACWAIEEKKSNKVIGYISMLNTSLKNKQCTLTWTLNSNYWGLGYSEEILKTMLKYLFDEHPFEIIIVKYYSNTTFFNPILDSVGMKKDAVLRYRRINPITGDKESLIVYSILKEEMTW